MPIPRFDAAAAPILIAFDRLSTRAGRTDLSPIVAGIDLARPAAAMGAGCVMALRRRGQDLWLTFSRPDLRLSTPLIAMFHVIRAAMARVVVTLPRRRRAAVPATPVSQPGAGIAGELRRPVCSSHRLSDTCTSR